MIILIIVIIMLAVGSNVAVTIYEDIAETRLRYVPRDAPQHQSGIVQAGRFIRLSASITGGLG